MERHEHWGDWVHPDTGAEMSLYRGPRNRVTAETADGSVLWTESNVAPAFARAYYEGWHDASAPEWLNLGAVAEVRRKVTQ